MNREKGYWYATSQDTQGVGHGKTCHAERPLLVCASCDHDQAGEACTRDRGQREDCVYPGEKVVSNPSRWLASAHCPSTPTLPNGEAAVDGAEPTVGWETVEMVY